MQGFKHVYGPVPSRRLGRSLGVDTMPFKTCSFDCVYCQLGHTTTKTQERAEYEPVSEILEEVERKLAAGDKPDYIGFAGSGEPTLHSGLGRIIDGIKAMVSDVPVVVFTNGSLLWREDVRRDLCKADIIIPSLDGGTPEILAAVNRPQEDVRFERIVEGLHALRQEFAGKVWLEVFLLEGVNDDDASIDAIARIADSCKPDKVQLNSVCRPPAESTARPVSMARLQEACTHFHVPAEVIAEHLDDDAHRDFRKQIKPEEILALIERRACTAAGVGEGLHMHVSEAVKHLEMLVAEGKAKRREKEGQTYYISARSAALCDMP